MNFNTLLVMTLSLGSYATTLNDDCKVIRQAWMEANGDKNEIPSKRNCCDDGIRNRSFQCNQNNTRIVTVEFDEKNLSGPLPAVLSKLDQVTSIDFYGNDMVGTVPQSWTQLKHLRVLYLAGNKLTGAFPNFNNSSLEVCVLSGNTFCQSATAPIPQVCRGVDAIGNC